MAKLQMQRVYLCALKREQKQILETLQRLETVEITAFEDQEDDDEKIQISQAQEDAIQLKQDIKTSLDDVKYALDILKKVSPEKISDPFFLQGRKMRNKEEYEDYESGRYSQDKNIVKAIIDNYKKLTLIKSEIAQLNADIESLKPWVNLDLPMGFEGTEKTSYFIGTMPNPMTKPDIEELIISNLSKNSLDPKEIPFEVQIVSTLDVLTYITLICLKKDALNVNDALRMSGFLPPVINTDKLAIEAKKEHEERIIQLKDELKSVEEKISTYITDQQIQNLRFLHDYEALRLDKQDAVLKLYQSNKAFVLTGYIAKENTENLKRILEQRFLVELRFEDTDSNDETVPVVLKNNGYANPIESVIESYSLPGVTDLDPTFPVAIFYYFMFGLMLSDAGYGFVIFIFSLIGLLKFKDSIEENWKKTCKMYMFCGAFTIFWGIMFGSYFGDMISVVSKTFFGKQINISPLWYEPVKDPMRLLTFSLIIGIIHLFTGMFLKAIELKAQKDYKSLFNDIILWYGLLIGCIIVLLSTQMLRNIFKYEFIIPGSILMIGKILAIASAVGIILTNGSSENKAVKVAQGLYSLYGISSYLSDVLSYSRLLALGLATGVIASVINMMASMVAVSLGGKLLGAIVFIVIMIFGHIFNLGINALGAYVHTNRLQYVELFGKFYDGGGIKFNPLKMNTKYFKFKESR